MDFVTLRDPRLLAELYARRDGSNEPETLLPRELARYYGLLARELGAVQLTQLEAQVVETARRDAERARLAGSPYGSFAAAVEAEVRRLRGLDLRSHWMPDDDALIAKASGWTPTQVLAVIDACERVRAAHHQGRRVSLVELLRATRPQPLSDELAGSRPAMAAAQLSVAQGPQRDTDSADRRNDEQRLLRR